MKSDPIQELDALVSRMMDGQLSEPGGDRLNQLLDESPAAVKRYLELLDNHEALCAIYPGEVFAESLADLPSDALAVRRPGSLDATSDGGGFRSVRWFAIAASLMIAVGMAGYFLGAGRDEAAVANSDVDASEQTIVGHATLRRSADLQWSIGSVSYREGDILPDGRLQFDEGIAEIDFFCGATLIVEGPAELDVQSDWAVHVHQGRLRANVPPAARGFVVTAADAEIIDLGTEFALDVTSESARVEVIDGEVELRGGEHDGDHLLTGQQQWLRGTRRSDSFDNLSNLGDVARRRDSADALRLSEWKVSVEDTAQDPRLIAYYPIAMKQDDRVVRNAAASGDQRDGTMVGPVMKTQGRFGAGSSGLEFDRIGARVRTRIDGQFSALTFSTWVRLDSLDHVYNALFMSDGYETGEVHWQIRNDGRMMFSVMVDDTQDVRVKERFGKTVVRDAGLHRVYFTPPIWDIAQSGQWFHLAAVFDPEQRLVTQYVNGQQVSSEAIVDKFFIDKLQIGAAEIGNWGQPFRDTPWFAVRNLNGVIDEMAIYSQPLNADEIHRLYEWGKPLGY
ncbi:FecR protein [Rubripirellula lacrimiformis]|uniref:FecR protein n=1 Tax=Rubripirellula lacrimiformis TaxID=1930273 RepID=A0A517ND17_9BACT|nr:LamG-like jellyroll fold domain-containing protein [Rubripirellula lacrimiformis]QDT04948.1 FecR protein [Rubripirellula lacrimiformis]